MKNLIVASSVVVAACCVVSCNSMPKGYKGKPYADAVYKGGAQVIPGKVECAFYDLGGEGVAYHDKDAINHGGGELNLLPDHHRPASKPYFWEFRKDDGMDTSYTKDFADFNHPNKFTPDVNQLYVGWTDDGEWCNYTVNVKKAGTYKITALYSYEPKTIIFDINGRKAAECKLPEATKDWHHWTKAVIGTITFPKAGRQLLTFHYDKGKMGNNFAYFEFASVETAAGGK
ncbi:MAG: carbohydrate-binding protein [Chthoniobacterales bacterium]